MIKYELDKTVWGFGIARIENNGKRWYISKAHRDGTYSWNGDYTYAKRWSKATAIKHLNCLRNNDRV